MPDSGKVLIGLTGNIACGKSLVSSMLDELGAESIDADNVAHEIMAPGSDVLASIADRFGTSVLDDDGSLNRPILGRIVFSDPAALRDLERITHPPTVAEILRRAKRSSAPVVVIDAIKLFEAGLADHCDENWAVYCDSAVQIRRLIQRNGISEDEARRRIDAQPPQDEKRERADRVIDNSGSVDDTRRQVERAWAELIKSRAPG